MSLSDKKDISAPFGNEEFRVVVKYDFDNDTGAIADYDVLENVGLTDMIVELSHIEAEETVVSADAIKFDLGVGDDGVQFCSDILKAELDAGDIVLPDTAGTKVRLAPDAKIVLGLEAFVATAGKFHMVFKVSKARYTA